MLMRRCRFSRALEMATDMMSFVSKQPLIGISGRRRMAHRLGGFPPNFADQPVDVHLAAYPNCVRLAGGLGVALSIGPDAEALVSRLDGVMLTGGADVDPRFYGATPHPKLDEVEPERDGFEIALARAAIDQGVPLLAICRGMQVLNVALGGTLNQHIERHAAWKFPADALLHDVNFTSGSLAHEVFGTEVSVNTLHHQSLDQLGVGLVATGIASDETVEAVELPGHQVLAVQWHPELVLKQPDPSFLWLVRAASK